MGDQETSSTGSAPLSAEEATVLERMRWTVRLQATAGALVFARALLIRHLTPVPGITASVVAMVAVAFGVTGLVAALGRRRRGPALAVFFRRALNGLVGVDVALCLLNVHVSGGANSFALPLVPLPMVMFGAFLPPRDAFAHAALASVLLGAALAAEHAGLLENVCLNMHGLACGPPSMEIALARYLTVVLMTFLASYITSFIGAGLRTQEACARRLAEERGHLAELRTRFVTMASHEFRTPLAVIRGASEALGRYLDRMSAAQRRARIERIGAAVEHMTDLLEDVLLTGRAEAGKVVAAPERVRLAALCRAVVAEIETTVGRTHALVVAARCGDAEAVLDPKLLRRALGNLLSNAVKYSADGSTVKLEVSRDDERFTLRVRDQGIGIPAEQQRRLFEPFERGANVGTRPGTGLGLTIAKQSVDLLGGSIVVESAVGAGTTVTVTLPAVPVSELAGGSGSARVSILSRGTA